MNKQTKRALFIDDLEAFECFAPTLSDAKMFLAKCLSNLEQLQQEDVFISSTKNIKVNISTNDMRDKHNSKNCIARYCNIVAFGKTFQNVYEETKSFNGNCIFLQSNSVSESLSFSSQILFTEPSLLEYLKYR
jgi:hypothetical protein